MAYTAKSKSTAHSRTGMFRHTRHTLASVEGHNSLVRRRGLACLVLASGCFVAAVGSVVSPADKSFSEVTWPGPSHELLGPAPVGTPFLLPEREPETLAVDMACAALDQPGAGDREDRVVLATARSPREVAGLVISAAGGRVSVEIGGTSIGTVSLDHAIPTDCRLQIEFARGEWSGRFAGRKVGGGTVSMPAMSGLYTDFPPAAARASPEVRFTTAVQDSSPSTAQIGWIGCSALLGALALALVVLAPSTRGGKTEVPEGSVVRQGWLPWDVFVFFASVAWWVVASPLSDDGWVIATVANHSHSGTFSNYYDAFNAPLPLGFLHDSLVQVLMSASNSLLVLRLPALCSGLLVWWMLRGLVDEGLDKNAATSTVRLARATLAGLFLLGWFGSAMTLRPEPLVALLLVVVARAVHRFVGGPSVQGLVIPFVATGVALSIHTTGLLVLASLVVATPAIFRFLRKGDATVLWTSVAVCLVSIATMMLLVFADTDLQTWRRAQQLTTLTGVHDGGASNEIERYRLLFGPGWGNPILRFACLMFAILSVVGVLRSVVAATRRGRGPEANKWALTWLLGAALLAVLPNKWPVHFTVLAGFGALSGVVEVQWWVNALDRRWARRVALLGCSLIVGISILVAANLNPAHFSWVRFGLTNSDWDAVASNFFWVWATLLLAGLALWSLLILGGRRPGWSPGGWLVPSTAVVVVVSALGVYAADGLRGGTPWSIAKQNLGLSRGECGLAGVLAMGDPRSAEVLPFVDEASRVSLEVTKGGKSPVSSSVAVVRDPKGALTTGWQTIGPDQNNSSLVVWFAGVGTAESGRAASISLEFGKVGAGGVDQVATNSMVPLSRYPWVRHDRWEPMYFRISQIGLEVDAVRVSVVSHSDEPLLFAPIAAVPTRPLLDVVGSRLVAAHVDLRPIFPCLDSPRIGRGLAEIPDFVLQYPNDASAGLVVFGRSSFFMLADAFEFPFTAYPTAPERSSPEWSGALVEVLRIDQTRLAPYVA